MRDKDLADDGALAVLCRENSFSSFNKGLLGRSFWEFGQAHPFLAYHPGHRIPRQDGLVEMKWLEGMMAKGTTRLISRKRRSP